jgi:NADH:ubiquinone oxidoreductase subunit F (NADH-binding)
VGNVGVATNREQREWTEIVAALKLASLCGLGTGLAEFAESILRYYPAEVAQCFK